MGSKDIIKVGMALSGVIFKGVHSHIAIIDHYLPQHICVMK